MKFSPALAVISVAALARAQSVDDLTGQIPSCYEGCIDAIVEAVGCDAGDWYCVCTEGTDSSYQDLIAASKGPCYEAAQTCSVDDALTVSKVLPKICPAAIKAGSDSSSSDSSSSDSSSDDSTSSSSDDSSDPPGNAASGLTAHWQSSLFASAALTLGMIAWL